MDRIEMVERLREKTGVSYEEAKAALEASDWDLLDAVVMLEKQGKVHDNTAYSTKRGAADEEKQANAKQQKPKGEGFDNFMAWVGRVIHKGNINSLVVLRSGEKKFSLPVTAVVLLLVFGFYVTVPLMIVGLFFGFHYKFTGPDLGKDSINNAMDRATRAAESIKEEFQEDAEEAKKEAREDLEELKKEMQEELDELQKEIDDMMDDLGENNKK